MSVRGAAGVGGRRSKNGLFCACCCLLMEQDAHSVFLMRLNFLFREKYISLLVPAPVLKLEAARMSHF